MNLFNKEKHVPWIVFKAKDWMDNYLKKDMNVFEYGSGGSTLYFSKKAKSIVSVEHNKTWYEEVFNVIFKEEITNCKYFLIEPKKSLLAKVLPYGSKTYISKTFLEYKGFSFKDYVKKIDNFPDDHFDLVFIDGRSRASCIKHSIRKIKKDGFLVLDNSERDLYRSSMEQLNKFKRIDFFGHGPYIEETWQTSVWKIN